MDDLIETFLTDYFTPELAGEINRSIELMENFSYNKFNTVATDILLTSEDSDMDNVKDQFYLAVSSAIEEILLEHTIVLNGESTLEEKNEVLIAIFRLQHLEDNIPTIRILESLESDEEQLALVITSNCNIDKTKFYELLDSFNLSILRAIKQMIYDKEINAKNDHITNPTLINQFVLFVKFKGEDVLGMQLVKNDILLGAEFEFYLPYIKDIILDGNYEQVAANLLSIYYISEDAYENPLVFFRSHSLELLQDLNRIGKIESILINIIGNFEEYKKATYEQVKLSQTLDR